MGEDGGDRWCCKRPPGATGSACRPSSCARSWHASVIPPCPREPPRQRFLASPLSAFPSASPCGLWPLAMHVRRLMPPATRPDRLDPAGWLRFRLWRTWRAGEAQAHRQGNRQGCHRHTGRSQAHRTGCHTQSQIIKSEHDRGLAFLKMSRIYVWDRVDLKDDDHVIHPLHLYMMTYFGHF